MLEAYQITIYKLVTSKIKIVILNLIHRFRYAYVLGAQKPRLIETVLLSTHNIYFG